MHTSKEETLSRVTKLSHSFKDKKGIAWAIEEKMSNRVIGDIGLYYISSDCKRAGLGFNIAQECWNKGYGTQALTLVLRYVISKMDIDRIEATCKIDNIASARVMEKAGMKFESILPKHSCKNGEYHDVKKFSIEKGDV